jgi:pimeloyl-ACP methyl ester carboxylesterase
MLEGPSYANIGSQRLAARCAGRGFRVVLIPIDGPNEMSWNTAKVDVEGIKLPYAEYGEGEPVVLVHGSNSDHRIWDQHRKIIGARHRVIAVSQRYFGQDPWPHAGEQFCISVLADDLASFLRGLKLAPVTIVGWSFGGAVSLTMALRNRQLVLRMLLYEPTLTTFVTDPDNARAAAEDRLAMMNAAKARAASADLAAAVRLFMDGVNAEEGAFDRLAPQVRTMMIENARMLPLLFAGPTPPPVTADDLHAFDRPVTIALGDESRAHYQMAARTAQSLLPLSRLEVVRGAKHLWPIQDPSGFSQLVLRTLDRD